MSYSSKKQCLKYAYYLCMCGFCFSIFLMVIATSYYAIIGISGEVREFIRERRR